MSKGNHLYIGIIFAFGALALFQYLSPNMLPVMVYYALAWISFELGLLECIKSIVNLMKTINKQKIDYAHNAINLKQQQINVFNKLTVLKDEVDRIEKSKQETESLLEKFSNERKYKRIDLIVEILSIFQIIICFIQVVVTILFPEPEGIEASKTIGILGLLSFTFLMSSYYITNTTNERLTVIFEKERALRNNSGYYIGLFEKVCEAEEKKDGEDCNDVKAKEKNNEQS